MSLEAIEMIVKAEQDGVSRRAAAEQEARNLTINAERDGQAMLSRLREEMETQRKELLLLQLLLLHRIFLPLLLRVLKPRVLT